MFIPLTDCRGIYSVLEPVICLICMNDITGIVEVTGQPSPNRLYVRDQYGLHKVKASTFMRLAKKEIMR